MKKWLKYGLIFSVISVIIAIPIITLMFVEGFTDEGIIRTLMDSTLS